MGGFSFSKLKIGQIRKLIKMVICGGEGEGQGDSPDFSVYTLL